MALGAVIHVCTVQLSHVDRGVHESLDLRVARHPFESEEFLGTRVLACCPEHRDGPAFSYLTLGRQMLSGPVTAHRVAAA